MHVQIWACSNALHLKAYKIISQSYIATFISIGCPSYIHGSPQQFFLQFLLRFSTLVLIISVLVPFENAMDIGDLLVLLSPNTPDLLNQMMLFYHSYCFSAANTNNNSITHVPISSMIASSDNICSCTSAYIFTSATTTTTILVEGQVVVFHFRCYFSYFNWCSRPIAIAHVKITHIPML